jgi:spectinomycin phosphotransferase
VRTRPPDLADAALRDVLADHWNFRAETLSYSPVGFGSHHWLATDGAGDRRFVTVDVAIAADGSRFDRLRTALHTAAALRSRADLHFVVPPLAGTDGRLVHVVDDRFAVSVFPYVAARPWPEDDDASDGDRAAVVDLLGRLHLATEAVRETAATDDLRIDARTHLEKALSCLDVRWDDGPFGEPARDLLRAAAGDVVALLRRYDDLAADLLARDDPWVVTHGEPHSGNLLAKDDGPLLVDWDTVLVAPRARDLWWFADHPAAVGRYTERTGQRVHDDDLALFRLRWDLTDLALYTRDLRGPHERTRDTEIAFGALSDVVDRASQR